LGREGFAMKLRKFREDIGYGRFSNRVGYVLDSSKLPNPTEGSQWREDPGFDEAAAVFESSQFQRVIDAVRQTGIVIVTG
jgi:hypothetical protein